MTVRPFHVPALSNAGLPGLKNVLGWYLPQADTHFEEYFAAQFANKTLAVLGGRAIYQPQQQFAAYGQAKQKRTAVDVGGHVGFWSWLMGLQFETVHSFEPLAANRAAFQQNVTLPNVQLYACGLGLREEQRHFNANPDNTGGGSINDGAKGTTIDLMPLDAFQLENVGFIKIDVEGFETDVIEGGRKTISQNKPVIILEQHDPAKPAVKLLETLGYREAAQIYHDYICIPA